MKARERGTALLLVLWASVLLAALLAGVAATSRSHAEAALYGSEHVRAELAAEAGLAQAVAGLRAPAIDQRWVPDGRPYTMAFDGAKVTVRVVDVSGLVDLNAASPDLLRRLFVAAGVDGARAARLAGEVARWRGDTPDGTLSAQQGGLDPGAPHGPFRTLDTLARLPGMDASMYARVAHALTIFSGRNFPDVAYAGPLVLAALRNVNANEAKTLVEERRARPAGRAAGMGQATGTVADGAPVAGHGGTVERVFSTAVMPDGTRVGLDITIRLALAAANARPYQVLEWRVDQGVFAP